MVDNRIDADSGEGHSIEGLVAPTVSAANTLGGGTELRRSQCVGGSERLEGAHFSGR